MIKNKSNKTLHICYATDENHIHYVTASIMSIIRRRDSDTTIVFYILGDMFRPDHNAQFDVFNQIDGIEVVIIPLDSSCIVKPNENEMATNYIKLAVPAIDVFNSIDRVLYLDPTVFARKDISQVYHADLMGCSIGMVKDEGCVVSTNEWPPSEYFNKDYCYNTGLVVMDLKRIRENKTHFHWIQYARAQESSAVADQLVINYINHYDCKSLPITYRFPYHELVKENNEIIRNVRRWNNEYATNYSSMRDLLASSCFWHIHGFIREMTKKYPVITRILSLLMIDYNEFVATKTIKPWEPKDDAVFYLNPDTME